MSFTYNRQDAQVMRTLAEARAVLLGKSGRVPQRFYRVAVEEEPCTSCDGSGSGRFSECSTCHGSGVIAAKWRHEYTGIYERKLGRNAYLYETREGHIELRLHSTVIARWTPWWVELYCGDWPTMLTRDYIERFTPADIDTGPYWRVWDGPREDRHSTPSLTWHLSSPFTLIDVCDDEDLDEILDGRAIIAELPEGNPCRSYSRTPDGRYGVYRQDGETWALKPARSYKVVLARKHTGEFGERLLQFRSQWPARRRDLVAFFDGIKLNEEGYVMNPPLLSEQRRWDRVMNGRQAGMRVWARELLKASRAGDALPCERCEELIALQSAALDPIEIRNQAREHTIDHYLDGELTHNPYLHEYRTQHGKGHVHTFARAIEDRLWSYAHDRTLRRVTVLERVSRWR